MSVSLLHQLSGPWLRGRHIFLSAGIPDQPGWDFDPLEITDAVIASTSAILEAGGRLLSGGHPAITPLLLRVARDFKPIPDLNTVGSGPRELVTVYQSDLYAEKIPNETWQLEAEGFGRLRLIDAVPGERPAPGENEGSLALMRQRMLAKENAVAFAIFIGGMDGIPREYAEFRKSFADRPAYALGEPGGAARQLARDLLESSSREYDVDLRRGLLELPDYGALMDEVLADAAARLGD